MNKPADILSLKFSTPERFISFWKLLKQGRASVSVREPLAEGAAVCLKLSIPDLEEKVKIDGVVMGNAAKEGGSFGVVFGLGGQRERVVDALERKLLELSRYRDLLATPPDKAQEQAGQPGQAAGESEYTDKRDRGGGKKSLSVSWLKEAVEQPEIEETAKETGPSRRMEVAPLREKTRLTAEERAIAEPVGEFIRNLTKAMLKSGYYSPDHPEAGGAKKGLYEAFRKVTRNIPELVITNRETRDQSDLLVTGVLDEPVSVETIVGANTAELFVPKLQEFCRRKGLVSFAISRGISQEHFELFIDIMSDPVVDHAKDKKAGALLTRALVDNGITEVSTVFVDDMIELERKLPWRVEMAICRLTKDLQVMPMFKGMDGETLRELKRNIVADIIRPLKHPRLLNDLLVNCYIISRYVKNVPRDEIERDIVEAFPVDMLLPTVEFTFKELERLIEKKEEHPDNPALAARILGIKRMLSLIAERVVPMGTAESHAFLQALYEKQILGFKDLPANIQYFIRTRMMADDVEANIESYINGITGSRSSEDAIVYLKCFRRVAGLLMERQSWATLLSIADAVKRAAASKGFPVSETARMLRASGEEIVRDKETHVLFMSASDAEAPLLYVFKDSIQQMVTEYARMVTGPLRLKQERKDMDSFVAMLGQLGIVALLRVMAIENNNAANRAALELLASMGEPAVTWARARLAGGEELPAEECIPALSVIAMAGRSPDDYAGARRFLSHPNARARMLALEAAYATKPTDLETVLIDSLNDDDKDVRDAAGRFLSHISPLSDDAMGAILEAIESEPGQGDDPEAHVERTVRLISAVKRMKSIADPEAVESRMIELAKVYEKRLSSWKSIFSKKERWRAAVLAEIIGLLGEIGGRDSEAFLEKMIRDSSDVSHGEFALEAMKRIVEREGESPR